MVILGSNTAAVRFNMLCAEFDIVELVPGGGYNPATRASLSQPAGAAWIIQSKVDLRMSLVDRSQYSQLPPDVRAKIRTSAETRSACGNCCCLAAQLPNIQEIKPGTKLHQLLAQRIGPKTS